MSSSMGRCATRGMHAMVARPMQPQGNGGAWLVLSLRLARPASPSWQASVDGRCRLACQSDNAARLHRCKQMAQDPALRPLPGASREPRPCPLRKSSPEFAQCSADVSGPCRTTLVLMGVSGSGKTTVGRRLAGCLRGAVFEDADDFHSDASKAKMQQGIPLTDEDRVPWLNALAQRIAQHQHQDPSPALRQLAPLPSTGHLAGAPVISISPLPLNHQTGAAAFPEARGFAANSEGSPFILILACSALKPEYRDVLRRAAHESSPAEVAPSGDGHPQGVTDGSGGGRARRSGDDQSQVTGGTGGGEWAMAERERKLNVGQGQPSPAHLARAETGPEGECAQEIGPPRVSAAGDPTAPGKSSGRSGSGERLKPLWFVHLQGSAALFSERVMSRAKEGGHFMPASLVPSQMSTLQFRDQEDDVIHVDASKRPEEIVQGIARSLGLRAVVLDGGKGT